MNFGGLLGGGGGGGGDGASSAAYSGNSFGNATSGTDYAPLIALGLVIIVALAVIMSGKK
jgi:hypothetical protein